MFVINDGKDDSYLAWSSARWGGWRACIHCEVNLMWPKCNLTLLLTNDYGNKTYYRLYTGIGRYLELGQNYKILDCFRLVYEQYNNGLPVAQHELSVPGGRGYVCFSGGLT